jgi:zeaxanthin glucosyltransferase
LNTVLESLSTGVPMIALPITNDQPGVAARIANKNVGVVIPPEQATPEKFVTAIKRVLGDSTFWDNARRMQKVIRSVDGPSVAADILARAFELEERRQGAARLAVTSTT